MSVTSETYEKKTRTVQGGLPAQWVVVCRGEEVGLIERFSKGPLGKHEPWQAYLNIGMGCRFLSSHYEPAGRICARNAILRAAGLLE